MLKAILLLTTITLSAAVYDLRSNDFLGRMVIQPGDVLIISPNNKILLNRIPSNIKVILCRTLACHDSEVRRLKHLYRTNGIGVHVVN